MTMIPFGGFFMAGMTQSEEIAEGVAFRAEWPQYYEGQFETEGSKKDPIFQEARMAQLEAWVKKFKKSFVLQGLAKVGVMMIVKALPGGREYAHYTLQGFKANLVTSEIDGRMGME